MATNQINTRVLLKYDSLSNWQTKNPTLLAGELAIAYLADSHTTTTPDNGTHPILFKVGPGAFNSLPFASALAADVYAWAKKTNPDWNDIPEVPEAKLPIIPGIKLGLSVKDEGTGKFVTDIEYDETTKTFTVSRNDVDWNDIQNKPEFDFGVTEITAEGDEEVKLEVDNSTGEVKITAEHTKHAAGSAKTASTAAISGYAATGTIKIPKLVTNKHGHVTEIGEETVSIEMPPMQEFEDTNTAHEHTNGSGIKLDTNYATGGIEGTVKLDLNIAMELINSDIVIYDADDNTKTAIASMPASDFIKDGMIQSVELVDRKENEDEATGQYLKITWNIDDANSTDADDKEDVVYLDVTKLVDVYTGGTTDDITVSVSDTNVITATLNKQFKTKQASYSADGSTTKTITAVSQNENGEVTVTYDDIAFPAPVDISGKKDKQVAVANQITKPAHVLSSLTQNENGDISYGVKELTPGDIGAQPSGNYKEKQTAAAYGPEDHKWINSLTQNENGEITATLTRPSAYDLEEVSTAKNSTGTDVDCLIFYCGTASDLV